MKHNGRCTVTFRSDRFSVSVPDWVVDLESFRRWADSDDFTEKDRVSWLLGEVQVDTSKEQLFTHGQVKLEVAAVLYSLIKTSSVGYYWGDGAFLSNEDADISVKPDGIFVSMAGLEAGTVRLVEGMEDGHVEIEGAPDMVLEVVSDGSVRKDKVRLRKAYWKAGIAEYWLVDARTDPLDFDILRRGDRGYVPVKKQKGWVRSIAFERSFRLTRSKDAMKRDVFSLDLR